ncbi:MAG: ABC transporter ATP-binding protein [Ruminiclostridium sp.]
MAYLSMEKLRKVYPNGFTALKDIDMQIEKGEFIVLLGPSGCGKTTALRMIAGLEKVTEGNIILDNRRINNLEPRDRSISMIFQSYAVWPHMTVYENIAYPLKLRKYSKAEIKETVGRVAAICEIEGNLNRYPTQLSGGQRQRVAVARAIAVQSKLFLMDEPLSNLDAKLRVSVRTFLKQIHQEYHATTIFVTHDQSEAMALADRIVVMNKGQIEQTGSTMEIYSDCQSLFVANFMGTPPANVEEAEVMGEDDKLYAVRDGFKLLIEGTVKETIKRDYAGKKILAAIRPENIILNGKGPFAKAHVEIIEPQGSHTILAVKVCNKVWKVLITENRQFTAGEAVTLSIDSSKVMFFDKETEKRIR